MSSPHLAFAAQTLPSGLRVLVFPRPGCGVATVDAWVAVGSADEPPEIIGVSHFLEHMLFKGTERYGVGEIDRLVEGMGGVMNASTSHDFTHYHVTAGRDRFTTALDVIAEVIGRATLDAEELERERRVILEEYHRKQDDPQDLIWERLYDEAYARGPYKAPALGTPETLERTDRARMMDYYRRHYAPANATLLIVGDVDAGEALAAAARAFEGFDRPFDPLLDAAAHETVYARGVKTVLEKDINDTYGVMAFPAPSVADHAQAYALDVLQFVLGGGRASVLYQEIKEKRRLATTIGAGWATSRRPGLFCVYFTCDESDRAALEGAVLEQLDAATQSPPPPAALDRARRLLINTHLFSLETTNGQSSAVGYYHAITGGLEFERSYTARIAEVGAQDVQTQARRWLRPESVSRVVIRPKGR